MTRSNVQLGGQELKLDADADTSITVDTDDQIDFKVGGNDTHKFDANGHITLKQFLDAGTAGGRITGASNRGDAARINLYQSGTGSDGGEIRFEIANSSITLTERVRMDTSGNLLVSTTSAVGTSNNTNEHIELREDGVLVISKNSGVGLAVSRGSDDGDIVQIQQAGTVEGTISVSGSTVSYNGFTGLHESSGIATNTAIGTVVSTIDELDVYSDKQVNIDKEEDNPKAGNHRPDHPKVKVSDTAGDKAVYGVVTNFNTQGKVNVASVGVGSVRVTGACAKGDLLESNGVGTAKVQSDDIVRSKTIGKVTIGNSNSGVKLVSCVLYCG